MFSGIVEEYGRILANTIATDGRLRIGAQLVLGDIKIGNSIAVNGCCLTVAENEGDSFIADITPETASRTNLAALKSGDVVNLESSLRMGDSVGGHLVSGHIDGLGTIVERQEEGNSRVVRIKTLKSMLPFLVEKGSVAVDGISLTVVNVLDDGFTVSLIPHTLTNSNAQKWEVGTKVNLEADLVAKYVQRGLAHYAVSGTRQV